MHPVTSENQFHCTRLYKRQRFVILLVFHQKLLILYKMSSIVKGVSEPLNYLVIIIAGGWLLGSFDKKRKREIEIDRDRERASQRE